jgi:aminomethyltransferase
MASRTVLFEEHLKRGARMVEFAGWEMPVMYRGVIEEHKAVRTNVGLFDVSHMGEIFVEGPKAVETLQWFTSNDVSKLTAGHAHYSLLMNENGGIVDDLIIYCIEPGQKYLVCVNAANIAKDEAHMLKHNRGAVIRNESASWGQIAVQGPKAIELVKRVFNDKFQDQKAFQFHRIFYKGSDLLVARTGYTGEDGVEIFVAPTAEGKTDVTVALWNDLLSQGEDLGAEPIGLGARDSLRTEMKYSLYGHEINDETNPYEAKLGWVVKLDKGDFLGKKHLLDIKASGTKRELIGFQLIDKGIPREGYPLISFDNFGIGTVTSGTLSPSSGLPIGIGYVTRELAKEGAEFYVEIRGRKAKARVVKTPFVSTTLTKAKALN